MTTITMTYDDTIADDTLKDEQITLAPKVVSVVAVSPSVDVSEIIISILLWLMCLITAIGNALVIVVFIRDRRVRNKVSNLYILNLAIADFFVGSVSLPINYFYRQTGVWPFSEAACKIWLLVDFTACFESVWAVVLISYDRYLLVTTGLEYDKYQTRKTFARFAAITWSVSFLRYFWMFVGYDLFNEPSIDYTVTCDNRVFYMLPYIVCDWIVTFFIPVLLTLFFNVKLYADIKRRSRGLPRNWGTVTPGANRVIDAPTEDTHSSSHTPSQASQEQPQTSKKSQIHLFTRREVTTTDEQQVTEFNNNAAPSVPKDQILVAPNEDDPNGPKHVSFIQQQNEGNNNNQHQRPIPLAPKKPRREGTADIRKHRRTAITLGLIVTVSALCWAPYYVYVFLNFAFKVRVSYTFLTVSYYIWWGNSTLNPLLYVATNPGIRKGIASIMRIRKY